MLCNYMSLNCITLSKSGVLMDVRSLAKVAIYIADGSSKLVNPFKYRRLQNCINCCKPKPVIVNGSRKN